MKTFRCIYMVEAHTLDGELTMRRFARNKRTAEKIARRCKKGEPVIRPLQDEERAWIDPADVEG